MVNGPEKLFLSAGRQTAESLSDPALFPGVFAQPRGRFFRSVLRNRPSVVFGGKTQQTIPGHGIISDVREAAASVGLFTEIKGLRHRTLTRRGGSPSKGSRLPAPERSFPAIAAAYAF
jgi:hypothetical protein